MSYIDSSRGIHNGCWREDIHNSRSGNRLRHQRRCSIWCNILFRHKTPLTSERILFGINEIAVGFVYYLVEGERLVIFRDNILEIIKLVLVNNADEHVLGAVCVSTDSLDLRCAVLEESRDLGRNLVGMSGNNCELVCSFRTFYDVVTHKG